MCILYNTFMSVVHWYMVIVFIILIPYYMCPIIKSNVAHLLKKTFKFVLPKNVCNSSRMCSKFPTYLNVAHNFKNIMLFVTKFLLISHVLQCICDYDENIYNNYVVVFLAMTKQNVLLYYNSNYVLYN